MAISKEILNNKKKKTNSANTPKSLGTVPENNPEHVSGPIDFHHPIPPKPILYNSFKEAKDACELIFLKPGEAHTEFYKIDKEYHCVVAIGNINPGYGHLYLTDSGNKSSISDQLNIMNTSVNWVYNQVQVLNTSVKNLNTSFIEVKNQFNQFKTEVTNEIQSFIETVNREIIEINNKVNAINTSTATAINEFEEYVNNKVAELSALVNTYNNRIAELESWHQIVDASLAILDGRIQTESNINAIQNVSINLLKQVSDNLQQQIIDLSLNTNQVVNKVEQHIESSINAVESHIDASINETNQYIKSSINEVNQHINASINEVNQHINVSINAVEQHINSSINEVNQYINASVNEIELHIDSSITAVEQHINSSITAVEQHINSSISDVEQHIDASIAAVKSHIDTSIAEVKEYINTSINAVNQHINASINAVEQHIDTSIAAVESHIDASIAVINKHIDSSIDEINQHINASVNEINQHINSSINAVNQHINSSINAVEQHIDTSIAAVESYINSSINEINQHINSSISAVEQHIDSSIQELKDLINVFEPISNPSIDSLFHKDIYTINLCCYTEAGYVKIFDDVSGGIDPRVAECTPKNEYKTYVAGNDVSFMAITNKGYKFVRWYVDGEENVDTSVIKTNFVDKDIPVIGTLNNGAEPTILNNGYTALFKKLHQLRFTLHQTSDGSALTYFNDDVSIRVVELDGTTCYYDASAAAAGEIYFDDNARITIKALPDSDGHHTVDQYIINDNIIVTNPNVNSYLLQHNNQDVKLDAYFGEYWIYVQTAANPENCADTYGGDHYYLHNSSIAVRIFNFAAGYEFNKWTDEYMTQTELIHYVYPNLTERDISVYITKDVSAYHLIGNLNRK